MSQTPTWTKDAKHQTDQGSQWSRLREAHCRRQDHSRTGRVQVLSNKSHIVRKWFQRVPATQLGFLPTRQPKRQKEEAEGTAWPQMSMGPHVDTRKDAKHHHCPDHNSASENVYCSQNVNT